MQDQNDIIFSVKVPGATEGAAAMAGLAQSMRSTNESLVQSSVSAKNASSSLRLVVDNTKQANESLRQTADTTRKAEDSLRGMAVTGGRAANMLNIVGAELVHLNPELATMTQAVGRSGSAISGMTSALGGGAGFVAGGLLAAIGLYLDHTRRAKEETEKLASVQRESAKAMETQYQEALKLARMDLSGLSPGQAALQDKIGSVGAQLEEARRRRANAGAEPLIVRRGIEDEIGTLKTEYRKLQDQRSGEKFYAADKKAGEIVDFERDNLPDKGKPDLDALATKKLAAERAAGGAAEYERSIGIANKAQGRFDDQKATQDAGDIHDRVKADKVAVDAEMRAQRDKEKTIVSLAKERDKELAYIDEKQKKRHDELREVGISAFSAIGAQGISALQKLATGQKVTIKDLLGGIGSEMVAEGTRYGFKGAAELLMGNPAGAALVGIGAAEVAAGLALGAATKGSSAPGSSGGSVGSGPTYWNGSSFVRGQPAGPVGGGQPVSGGSTMIVNVSMPTQIRATGDDGVAVYRGIQQAQREGKIPRAA